MATSEAVRLSHNARYVKLRPASAVLSRSVGVSSMVDV